MISNQFILPIASELAIDLFAGGGGASTGIEQAIGRHVDIAVNHDPEAVSLHQANHPQTRHFVSDVFEVDPLVVTDGQPVGLLWASPDCKHFSKAKGGKPVSKKIRSLAGVVIKWAKLVRPRVICLENVEEFQTWGPLIKRKVVSTDAFGKTKETWAEFPCPQRKGETFKRWVSSLRNLGYKVEWKELRASDYGTPTIRKRLFLVARRDGMPIVWPEPTHGAPTSLGVKQGKLKVWRTAADCIDWSIPAPSIFERERPLAEATLRRIAKGIMRYVVEADEPFIVPGSPDVAPFLTEHANASTQRTFPADEPLRTQVAQIKGGHFALVAPTLVQTGYGEREGQAPRALDLHKPLGTVVAGQKHALVSAMLAKHYGGVVGTRIDVPTGTITTADHHSLVTSNLVKLRGDNIGSATDEPVHTISAQGTHHGEVRAFLIKYYGSDQDPQMAEPLHTITTRDRFGLVTIKGEPYAIVDIGLRMLSPRELYRAQGFPETYQIDRGADGRPLTKTAQVRMCGNSVCPPLAKAIVAANYIERQSMEQAA